MSRSGSNAGSNRAAQLCTPTHVAAWLKHVGAPPDTLVRPQIESRNAWAQVASVALCQPCSALSAVSGPRSTVGFLPTCGPGVYRMSVASLSQRTHADSLQPTLFVGETIFTPDFSHGCTKSGYRPVAFSMAPDGVVDGVRPAMSSRRPRVVTRCLRCLRGVEGNSAGTHLYPRVRRCTPAWGPVLVLARAARGGSPHSHVGGRPLCHAGAAPPPQRDNGDMGRQRGDMDGTPGSNAPYSSQIAGFACTPGDS